MRRRNLKTHWNSEICTPKLKQSTKEQEKSLTYKNAKHLYHIRLLIWQ